MNTYGTRFRLTTFGESHGPATGGVIDGCPAGLVIDQAEVARHLERRRGDSPEGTGRREKDRVEWLSGLANGVTLGTPIAFEVRNLDTRPDDYEALRDVDRPGHADYTYRMRYGLRDHRGGGRASARETVARVVAGSVARQILAPITIAAEVTALGPDVEGDTRGGVVGCRIEGLAPGVGDPVFGKLGAALANAMMSIPSAIGFEMGSGFAAATMTGSQFVDQWAKSADGRTQSNHCGGVQGGISNGMPVEFRVAFHPVVTLPHPVEGLHHDGHLETIALGGRHDRCQVQRAPVIVESMAALCLVNYVLG